ncbi:MAG: hypothetical protein JSS72_08045 [Armatimonadetes bacterium]|nr:hypothetical protein [Armatimonadota bacterium]
MSDHAAEHSTGSGEPLNLAKLGPLGGLIAIIGLGALLAFVFSGDKMAITSYLYGWMCWTGLSIGCFGWTLLHHSVRGKWALPLLRIFEAGGSATNFIALLVLYIPIWLKAGELYPWADAAKVAADPTLQHRAAFYTPTFVLFRTAFILLSWAFIANKLRQSTIKQDETKDFNLEQGRTNFATPMLVWFVVTLTLAVTDWVMALSAHWYSTMFGGIFVDGTALSALSMATFVACRNYGKEPFVESQFSANRRRDIGNLLLAFTMIWAYFNYSQLVIIWSGNLPTIAQYYVDRGLGGYQWIGLSTMLGQFFVPFLALLAPRTKARPSMLAKLALWIFCFRFVDLYYIVVAMVRKDATPQIWDIVALVGFAGLWLWVFGMNFQKAKATPQYDPRILEVAH